MSINTPNIPEISGTNLFDSNPAFESSAHTIFDQSKEATARYSDLNNMNYYRETVTESIPIETVLNEMLEANLTIHKVIREIDDFLSTVYVDASLSPDLEEAHHQVWSEVVNKMDTSIGDVITISNKTGPNYISYEELCYAKEHKCRGCRALVLAYESYVGKTALSYYFDIKTFVNYMLYEINVMIKLTNEIIGDTYDDEVEQAVAKEFYFWAKSVKEYTKLFTKEIFSIPPEIPQSQVDYITKVQAAQFEAFFSLKINSYESEIKKLLGLSKRELVDTSEMFYHSFLGPALKSRSLVAYPLELGLLSGNFKNKAPFFAEEIVMATSSINGNLSSLIADLKQKRFNTERIITGIIGMIRDKRRYISYSRQMQLKAKTGIKKTFIDVDSDPYKTYFDEVVVSMEKHETLNSSHGLFNDLLEDSHPQYLLRSGGTITGDINISGDVRVAGIDIANHTHSGTDGSSAIKASSIDYVTDRLNNTASNNFTRTDEPITLDIETYNPQILVGGVPVVDVVINSNINSDTEEDGRYTIKVSYIEIEE